MAEPHSEGFVQRCHVGQLPESAVSWTFLSEAKCDHLIGERESTLDGGTSEKTPGPGCVLAAGICSVLVNIPCELGKNVNSAAVG